jgi:hypothetical protein
MSTMAQRINCTHGFCHTLPNHSEDGFLFAANSSIIVGVFCTGLGAFLLCKSNNQSIQNIGTGLCIGGGTLMVVSIPLYCTYAKKKNRKILYY